MIIKYILILFVLLLSFWIGYLMSCRYTQRVIELKELQTALNLLETKIQFTYEPLPEIFLEIREMLKGNIEKLFQNININLHKESVEDSIVKALTQTELNLVKEDKKVVETLSKILGKTDKDGQVSQIELTKSFIQSQLKKAEREEEKNGKLYKTLGITVGLTLAIILI